MRKITLLMVMLLLCVNNASAQSYGFGDWVLAGVQSATTYGETRQMIVSPDGSRLAWSDSTNFDLCVYTFAMDETTCSDYPDTDPEGNNALLRLHDTLVWSPDSTKIVLTEEFFRELLESDIWIYEVESATFTNLTSDDASGSLVRLDESGTDYIIDTYPIWHPVTHDLYFWRYTPTDDGRFPYTTALYRFLYNEGTLVDTPELVLDLTNDVPSPTPIFNAQIISFNGSAVFAPDGSQMAVLVRPPVGSESAIWIIDLTDNTVQEVASFESWVYLGIPEWEAVEMIPEGISWTADGNLVFSTTDQTTLGAPITWNAYTLNIENGIIEPIFDFSEVVDAPSYYNDLDADGNPAGYAYPRTAIIAPDGETLLYFNYNRGLDRINLSALDIINGGEPFVIVSIPSSELVFATMNATSIGYTEDTLRLLMYGYLFTFAK